MSRKKIKRQLTRFFKRRLDKEKDKERDKERDKEKDKEKDKVKEREPCPPPPSTRPSTLPLGPPAAPENSPLFYEEVAERLEQIAYRSSTIKRPSPKPPIQKPPEQESPPRQPSPGMHGLTTARCTGAWSDIFIESDPFLRSSLSRLSYTSFAHLQDAVINDLRLCDVPTPPPDTSPTLRRIAVSMEVSRRIVTATGTQRMQGYAECYMENFAPWVKRQGGWVRIFSDLCYVVSSQKIFLELSV
uniref:Uncharacterized protein n=1 Tax=Periophthalmus magnuspinnatus TaxID=409849 RepID=A0A3B3ZYW4_9GOBI